MDHFTFRINDTVMTIIPECMGFRSLSVLVILSLIFWFHNRLSPKRGLKLVAIGAGLAVVSNLLRILSIVLIAYFNPRVATGIWHDFAGYLFVILAIIGMSEVGDIYKDLDKKDKEHETAKDT